MICKLLYSVCRDYDFTCMFRIGCNITKLSRNLSWFQSGFIIRLFSVETYIFIIHAQSVSGTGNITSCGLLLFGALTFSVWIFLLLSSSSAAVMSITELQCWWIYFHPRRRTTLNSNHIFCTSSFMNAVNGTVNCSVINNTYVTIFIIQYVVPRLVFVHWEFFLS